MVPTSKESGRIKNALVYFFAPPGRSKTWLPSTSLITAALSYDVTVPHAPSSCSSDRAVPTSNASKSPFTVCVFD